MNSPNFKGLRLLIVEDEHIIAKSLFRMLLEWGVEVVGIAPSVKKAIALLDQTDGIDAALLDIKLKKSETYPLADILVERGVPFLFTTGYDSSVIPARFRWAGVVQKPYDMAEMAKALSGFVR